jgi:hypothetical protein
VLRNVAVAAQLPLARGLLAVFLLYARETVKGQAQTPQSAPKVSAKFRVAAYSYPANDAEPPPANFAVIGPGLILVPVSGGLAIAGLNTWYVRPQSERIVAVAYAQHDSLFVVQSSPTGDAELVRAQGNSAKMHTLNSLPPGWYQISAGDSGNVWVWGRDSAGAWHVWRIGDMQIEFARSSVPIGAATPVGSASVVIGRGRDVLLLQSGSKPKRLFRSKRIVDGLAVNSRGHLFVSSTRGIFSVGNSSDAELIATGVHGFLQERGGLLYVLWRPRHQVLAFARKH